MNKISAKRKEELLQLAEYIAIRPMSREEMASQMKLQYSNFSKYITWLLSNKKIYICDWRLQNGRYVAIYTKGNQPNAPKKKFGAVECNRRHRQREKERLSFSAKDFIPKPDIAAAWMFNPC